MCKFAYRHKSLGCLVFVGIGYFVFPALFIHQYKGVLVFFILYFVMYVGKHGIIGRNSICCAFCYIKIFFADTQTAVFCCAFKVFFYVFKLIAEFAGIGL